MAATDFLILPQISAYSFAERHGFRFVCRASRLQASRDIVKMFGPTKKNLVRDIFACSALSAAVELGSTIRWV
jgi:hypothetical protein